MSKKAKLKKDKERLSRLSERSLSTEAFLSRIIGIRNQEILSREITHDTIKQLFPQLKRASFDFVLDNPSLIGNSTILLVSDPFGRVIPYWNPKITIVEEEYYGEYLDEEPKKEAIPNIDNIDLSSLSNYDLQQLFHVYKKNFLPAPARKVHQELINRKDSHHAAKTSKARSLRKENKNRRYDY